MNKPEAAGRMVQWAVKLSQFVIEYHPRIAIKTQALANFIAEFTLSNDEKVLGRLKEMDDPSRRFVS